MSHPEITSKLVQQLRERTGAGMMDCKRALVAAKGDIEAAIQAMRKAGEASAVKKAGRIAAEGLVNGSVSSDAKTGALIEVNCETDFVARDENFKQFAAAVVASALSTQANTVEVVSAAMQGSQTIEQLRQALVAKLGENIQIRRVHAIKAQGQLGVYLHGGRIGVLIDVVGGDEALRKDLAMHIAASNPQVLAPENVSADLISKEKEIATAQAETSGKPAAVMEKMVAGRMKKFVEEISLITQPFVKDPQHTVGKVLEKAQAKVVGFIRFEVGEGIEKKTGNFAEEVMAQVQGK